MGVRTYPPKANQGRAHRECEEQQNRRICVPHFNPLFLGLGFTALDGVENQNGNYNDDGNHGPAQERPKQANTNVCSFRHRPEMT